MKLIVFDDYRDVCRHLEELKQQLLAGVDEDIGEVLR